MREPAGSRPGCHPGVADGSLYKYDSGTSAFVKTDLASGNQRVTSISISPTDSQKLFVTVNATKSIWYTTNGG